MTHDLNALVSCRSFEAWHSPDTFVGLMFPWKHEPSVALGVYVFTLLQHWDSFKAIHHLGEEFKWRIVALFHVLLSDVKSWLFGFTAMKWTERTQYFFQMKHMWSNWYYPSYLYWDYYYSESLVLDLYLWAILEPCIDSLKTIYSATANRQLIVLRYCLIL